MMTKDERNKMNKELDASVAREVTVSVSTLGIVRSNHGFHAQMSIKGELQNLPDTDCYRVVVPENEFISDTDQTYVYFRASDVYFINPFVSTGVVISVRIDTPDWATSDEEEEK